MLRWALCLLLFLGLAGVAMGQAPVRILDVHAGFPYGPQTDWYKSGTWVPVLVKVGPPPTAQGFVALTGDFQAELVVSTTDGDGARTYFTPRPVSIKREEIKQATPDRTFVSYIKVAAVTNEIMVELRNARIEQSSIRVPPVNYITDLPNGRNNGMEHGLQLVGTLGRPRGLEPRVTEAEGDKSDPRSYKLSLISRLDELPEFWFGYESMDTLVLPTGGTWANSLAQSLANDPQRRVALEQWVAQGGHLIVTVGSNANIIASKQSFPLEPLLPATIDPASVGKSIQLDSLRYYLEQNVPGALRQNSREPIKAPIMQVAKLTPRGSGYPLVSEENSKVPVVVRGTWGLGRVTVVGFDVEGQGAFGTWENQQDFWTALLELKQQKQAGQRGLAFNPYERGATYSEKLGNDLESFGDVAVVSFFWVAIFILIYVLIIGPLDYFFLKKVVKRLELTWITFPLTVLLVSLAAYFGAYWLKGDELRLNKIDLVDIDQTHGLAVGTTWFSVFSPRLQSYDFALEPVGLGKAREGLALSWMARDGFAFRGIDRQQTDLFQREYELSGYGSTLTGVPIQVWAMKTFVGRWQTLLEGQSPVLSTLRGQNSLLAGTVSSRLPRDLSEAWLIYKNNVYKVGTLKPNTTFQVPAENRTLTRQFTFFTEPVGMSSSGQPLANFSTTISRLLFFRYFAQESTNDSNELLRYLDQSGRLNGDEAILLGIYEDTSGQAVEMMQKSQFGSKLQSPQLRGTLRQNTYVRVYLPVRGSEK